MIPTSRKPHPIRFAPPPAATAALLLCAALSGCAGSAPVAGGAAAGPALILAAATESVEIRDRSGAAMADAAALADALADADIVILGEVHDNDAHHEAQALLIAALAPGGIAFEMIPALAEDDVNLLAQAGADATLGDLLRAEAAGWDWDAYLPLLAAAPDAYIAGGGQRREDVRAAIRGGAAAVFGPASARFGLDEALDAETQDAMEAEQIAAHCDALPASAAPGMVEAQRLRDAAFAAATLRAHEEGGGPTVLITGAGHARTDRAVPVYLAAAAPDLSVVSLALVERGGARAGPGAPFDFIWVTEPAERGDPCDAFR